MYFVTCTRIRYQQLISREMTVTSTTEHVSVHLLPYIFFFHSFGISKLNFDSKCFSISTPFSYKDSTIRCDRMIHSNHILVSIHQIKITAQTLVDLKKKYITFTDSSQNVWVCKRKGVSVKKKKARSFWKLNTLFCGTSRMRTTRLPSAGVVQIFELHLNTSVRLKSHGVIHMHTHTQICRLGVHFNSHIFSHKCGYIL